MNKKKYRNIVQMFDGLLLEADCKQENVKYINLTLTAMYNQMLFITQYILRTLVQKNAVLGG